MFTPQQKREISMKIQTILQETLCSELPAGEIKFILHVDGAYNDSWANIRNGSSRDIPVPEVLIKNMTVK